MSLGLEELDISGNDGEDSSEKFARYAIFLVQFN
jgi:hypothetical protein